MPNKDFAKVNKLNKKVLIVDDDANARSIVRRALRKLDNVEFLEADNGTDAIRTACKELPSIILMDIVMPGIDGYEACREIKKNPACHHTIIIFMTAVSMKEIADRIIQAGGDDLLRKPLSTSELYFRVKNYLSLIPEQKSEILICHDNGTEICAEIDSIDLGNGFYYLVSAKSLCRDNHYIPLMKQEILLLEALIRHRNKVLTYSQLLFIIGKNDESTIGNLRTLVKLLRRKTYRELIRTLPSVGYQLVD